LLLIARIEYLLVLAQVYLRRSEAPLNILARLLDQSKSSAQLTLEVELLFAGAEVAWLNSDLVSANEFLRCGLNLVERCGSRQALRELQLRQPDLLSALGMTEPNIEGVAYTGGNNPLSQREIEVLKLIALGNSNQQIAEQLFISLHTVKTHARRIHGKLGVERRTHAVAQARLLGLLA
jgi:ATP/maltotriose-dependent transcriptional regulator MalT